MSALGRQALTNKASQLLRPDTEVDESTRVHFLHCENRLSSLFTNTGLRFIPRNTTMAEDYLQPGVWGITIERKDRGLLLTGAASLDDRTETPCSITYRVFMDKPNNPSETLKSWMEDLSFYMRPNQSPEKVLENLISQIEEQDISTDMGSSTFQVNLEGDKISTLTFDSEFETKCYQTKEAYEGGGESVVEKIPYRLEVHTSLSRPRSKVVAR